MISYKQQLLEDKFRQLCDELDTYLEDLFGDRYPLHPNRLPRGKASSVAYDGLFSTGTQFTLGYGSESGRGYIIDIDIVTLSRVKPEDRAAIEEAAMNFLRANLQRHFPDRKLEVVKDGSVYKLVGDFSLGNVQD